MSLSSSIVRVLKDLPQVIPSGSCQNLRTVGREFFSIVYKIAISDYKFTSEEKSDIGKLLVNSVSNLQFYLSLRVDDYDSHSGLIARHDRSSLQFLLDNYKDFQLPDGERLQTYLDNLIDPEDLKQWDRYLLNYIDGEEDAIVDISSKEFSRIPETHWWWSK